MTAPQSPDFTTAPEDATSVANLAEQGLRYALVDTSDRAAFGAWLHADDRGFLLPSRADDKLAPSIEGIGYRRTIGVYDGAHPAEGAHPETGWPIATVDSWPAELTIPGSTVAVPRTLSSWAISSVTVAATHRRRGIARNLLEGELRTAAALGVPMAMLTVSESSIYGRFGFAPAAFATEWTIDTRRVKWSGAAPSTSGTVGRVEYLSVAQYRDDVPKLYDRLRLANPGEIDVWPLRWDQLVGSTEPESERTKSLRAARYVDAEGVTRGLALFRLTGGDDDFSQHTVTVARLDAETPEAGPGALAVLLEYDLTIELKAHLRRVEEPMRWLLGDFRLPTSTPGSTSTCACSTSWPCTRRAGIWAPGLWSSTSATRWGSRGGLATRRRVETDRHQALLSPGCHPRPAADRQRALGALPRWRERGHAAGRRPGRRTHPRLCGRCRRVAAGGARPVLSVWY